MSLLRTQPSSSSFSVAPSLALPVRPGPVAPAPFVFQPPAPAPFVFQPPAPPQLPGTFWRNSTPTRPQDNFQQRGAPPMPLSNAAGNNSRGYQLGASSSSPSIVTPQQRAAESAMRRYEESMMAQRQAEVDAAFVFQPAGNNSRQQAVSSLSTQEDRDAAYARQLTQDMDAERQAKLDAAFGEEVKHDNDLLDRTLANGQLKSDPNSGTKNTTVHKPRISTRPPLRIKGLPQNQLSNQHDRFIPNR